MDCLEFRTLYSDFADGQLDELAEVGCHRHLAECEPCRRLHVAYQAGCRALRRQPQLAPSRDFASRLEARISADTALPWAAPDGYRQWTALAGALMAVALLTTAGWMMLDAWPGDVASHERPLQVRFAGDTSLDYGSPFTVIPASRLRPAPTPPAQFEITIDWMEP